MPMRQRKNTIPRWNILKKFPLGATRCLKPKPFSTWGVFTRHWATQKKVSRPTRKSSLIHRSRFTPSWQKSGAETLRSSRPQLQTEYEGYLVPIRGFMKGTDKFPIQKCAIFRKFKEIKELRGGRRFCMPHKRFRRLVRLRRD